MRGCGGRRRASPSAVAEDEFHLARRAQNVHHRRLQQRHVITFDPELINIIRHAQGHLLLVGAHESNPGKPSLISVDVDLRLDRLRDALPNLTIAVLHGFKRQSSAGIKPDPTPGARVATIPPSTRRQIQPDMRAINSFMNNKLSRSELEADARNSPIFGFLTSRGVFRRLLPACRSGSSRRASWRKIGARRGERSDVQNVEAQCRNRTRKKWRIRARFFRSKSLRITCENIFTRGGSPRASEEASRTRPKPPQKYFWPRTLLDRRAIRAVRGTAGATQRRADRPSPRPGRGGVSGLTSTLECRPLASYFSRRAAGSTSGSASWKPPFCWR